MIPVLFVMSCQNYESFSGLRLNNEAYTAYPYEQEIILAEGSEVIVLKVDTEFKLQNLDLQIANYYNRHLTLIHLLLVDDQHTPCPSP